MRLYVVVGSENPVKFEAVKEAFEKCHAVAEYSSNKSHSGVSKQPFSLEEMTEGAHNRAKEVREFTQRGLAAERLIDIHPLGVGVESGIFRVKDDYFDACWVAIYDGREFYDGISSSLKIPQQLIAELQKNDKELGDFFDGRDGGAIGAMTNNLVKRKEQIMQAAVLACMLYQNFSYRTSIPDQSRRAQYPQ